MGKLHSVVLSSQSDHEMTFLTFCGFTLVVYQMALACLTGLPMVKPSFLL